MTGSTVSIHDGCTPIQGKPAPGPPDRPGCGTRGRCAPCPGRAALTPGGVVGHASRAPGRARLVSRTDRSPGHAKPDDATTALPPKPSQGISGPHTRGPVCMASAGSSRRLTPKRHGKPTRPPFGPSAKGKAPVDKPTGAWDAPPRASRVASQEPCGHPIFGCPSRRTPPRPRQDGRASRAGFLRHHPVVASQGVWAAYASAKACSGPSNFGRHRLVVRRSRFIRAMKCIRMRFGQAPSHSP